MDKNVGGINKVFFTPKNYYPLRERGEGENAKGLESMGRIQNTSISL
jgi:hypothetical protein